MITGVVLARNEEANIVECLKAFRPHVEEMILIDMESGDRTAELARPLADQILSHPLMLHFDSARNIAIPAARHDWLWFCDADERIPEEVGRIVRELVQEKGHEFEALTIPFKTYFCGKWIEHCGWWPGYTMPRVLKRGHFRFREELHGGVEVLGRQIRLAADPRYGIDHFSYDSVEHYFEKFNRYTSGEAKSLAEKGTAWDWRRATEAMVADLWSYYERNRGREDGAHGWILSWLSGQYRWASHAKLIDNGDFSNNSPSSCPANLDEFFEVAQGALARVRSSSPQLPLGILFRSPIDDPSGYADEGRAVAKALAAGERALAVEPIRWSDKVCPIPDEDRTLFRALKRARRPAHFAAITNNIPTLAVPVAGAALNILRTTFETDRLPGDWPPCLEAFDEIWVLSRHNREAFIRSGVAPEKIRVVPSCLDTGIFTAEGPKRPLPPGCEGRFVFLSIFDWQLRKGWDVLLRTYVREFEPGDNTALLLKISRVHGHPPEFVRRQAEDVLAEAGTTLDERPDIIFWEELLDTRALAALYRSAGAFVLPSRGEGWGRPYMEAMACGLPVIGAEAGGNLDFMAGENCLLVPSQLVEVPDDAAREIPVFRGHRWFEPDEKSLRAAMRKIRDDESLRLRLSEKAAAHVRENFNLDRGREVFENALAAAEERFRVASHPQSKAGQITVALEGEVLSNHSFSNINECLAVELGSEERLALTVRPRYSLQKPDIFRDHRWPALAPYVDRTLDRPPQVTIRHAYPPDWSPVSEGKWVHIQPWEFGHLPKDWIEPLTSQVDEIWAPSHYVKNVYVRSGISAEKIHVIPWGVDPAVFHPEAIPRVLPTEKTFRFLYVGGTIHRKGFDVLLESFLEEFSPEDDVCLVVKDMGHKTVYRYGNFYERVLEEANNPAAPEILYFDGEMTAGQLASLYAACQSFAAPYRGEGFGMPILEAMACGLAAIVPRGGPTDDFVDEECGYLLDSREVVAQHPEVLCGPPTELAVDKEALRKTMRRAFEDREATLEKGRKAAVRVGEGFTWRRTAAAMTDRILALAQAPKTVFSPALSRNGFQNSEPLPVDVLVAAGKSDAALAACLAQATPFVRRAIVVDPSGRDRTRRIAEEYGAAFAQAEANGSQNVSAEVASLTESERYFWLRTDQRMTESDWTSIATALETQNGSDSSIPLRDGTTVTLGTCSAAATAAQLECGSPAMAHFIGCFYPRLEKRADTFRFMLEYLDRLPRPEKLIVETGCVRRPDDWSAGQSTLVFDAYAARSAAAFVSVDNDPRHCELARGYCTSAMTNIVHDDSVRHLQQLARERPGTIDLLYLDSFDIDWNRPHASALHHFKELCAAMPALRRGALVVIDDHRGREGLPGKSLYVEDYMKGLGIAPVFERYQVGWIVP